MTIGVLAALALVAFAGWVGYDLLSMQHHLERARASASVAQAALVRGDVAQVRIALATARSEASLGLASATGTAMTVAAHIPLLDNPAKISIDIARISAAATECLEGPGPRIAAFAAPDNVRSVGGGLNVRGLQDISADLSTLQQCMGRVATRADDIPRTSIPRLDEVRAELTASLARQSRYLSKAALVARVAPTMLGIDGDKTYLVALQTNAEARGTGGLIGGFLVVRAHQGRLNVIDRVDDLELQAAPRSLALGAAYNQLYGYADPTRLWQNSNLSPHFPYAAQIWKNLLKQKTGRSVDGVAAIDPVALGYLVNATGAPTLPNGETVSPQSFTDLAEAGVYARYENDKAARKAFLGDLGATVFNRTFAMNVNTFGIVESLVKSVDEQRISLWSGDPVIQQQLSTGAVAHTVPYSPAPYADVIVNNSAGSKLDYYLQRTIQRRVDSCDGDSRSVSVDVTLTNNVPAQRLPSEVLGPPAEAYGPILPGRPLPEKFNRLTVSLYSSWGTRFRSVTVDGTRVGFGSGSELGHPVAYAVVVLKPGVPTTISFSLDEPALPDPVDMPMQPLARDASITSQGPRCER